jgi:hypothetical protein
MPGEAAPGVVETQYLQVVPDEIHVGPAGVLRLVRGESDPQAVLQCRHRARVAELVERHAEVVERVRQGRRRVLTERDGPLGQDDGLGVTPRQRVQLCLVAERHRQQVVVAGGAEDGDRLLGRRVRPVRMPGPPADPREPAQGGSEGARVATTPQLDRPPLGRQRVACGSVDGVALNREALPQLRLGWWVEDRVLVEHQPQMGRRFPVRPRPPTPPAPQLAHIAG